MADKDVATGTWQCARVTGIAAALVLTMAVTPAVAKTHGPAHGTPGADNGKKLGWSKDQKPAESNGQKVRSHGKAPSPKPRPNHSTSKPATPPENSHAKAGKTTICHSTGSSTNPYVEITISNNALPAHARHHDGRDIIPAPAAGCESGAAQGVADATEPEDADGGVLGRHRTNRLADDAKTADEPRKGDAIPADNVLGAAETNVSPENASQPVAEEDDDGGSLPFTGLALGAVLLMGVVAVASGAALRRASRAELD